MVNEIDLVKDQGGMHLVFASLIIEIFKRAGVEEYNSDTWVYPNASHLSLEDYR